MGLANALYRQLEPSARDEGISPINALVVFLVLLSFLTFSLETEPTLPDGFRQSLSDFNVVIVGFFAVEYVLRLLVIGKDERYRGFVGRLKYMVSPYALADFLAFAPEMAAMFLLKDGNSEAVAALKALRLLRLLKLARFVPAFSMLSSAFSRCWSQLMVALALALALIYVSAIALYFIEGDHQPDAFGSIPRATWWAVATLTTVGYGDSYPVTAIGKFVAAMIALAGIGVVALPAGIFASAVSDEMNARDATAKTLSNDASPDADNAP